MGNSTVQSVISTGFWVLWGIVFVVLAVLVYGVVKRNLTNRQAPVKQEMARLTRLEACKGEHSPMRGCFENEQGERHLLFIDRTKAHSLYEGSEGLVTYKGVTFISFEPKNK